MDKIKWEEIYLRLYAYTDQLLKNLSWFRKNSDSFIKGKQVEDYVCDAIEKYLSEPEKFDENTGRSLLNYLKYHVVRSLVSNDINSAENTKTVDFINYTCNDNDDESYSEYILPVIAATFDEDIDYQRIILEIENSLNDDAIAKLIFQEVRLNGIPRRDFIKKHKIEEKDFDNGMKRLKTILKNIAKQYDYE
ncbi:hypothetical protein [Chryseobacterium flavum]|uniref:hypothetical protein n=1 Tax=Chryseobacterium flavum TaxID=415851 RepID=UPI0028AED088|nr:hypothetical protein [Chryseobacterium flavum]